MRPYKWERRYQVTKFITVVTKTDQVDHPRLVVSDGRNFVTFSLDEVGPVCDALERARDDLQ